MYVSVCSGGLPSNALFPGRSWGRLAAEVERRWGVRSVKWPLSTRANDNRTGINPESSSKCCHDLGVAEVCIIVTIVHVEIHGPLGGTTGRNYTVKCVDLSPSHQGHL